MKHLRLAILFVLCGGLLLSNAGARDIRDEISWRSAASLYEQRFCQHQLQGELWSRTELFFGLSRSSGPDITEAEFQHFVDTEITPHFPNGLTLIDARGQYLDASQTIIQEGAKVLILLYPFEVKSSQAIESIRERYKARFQQESVMRVDDTSCVSF